MTVPQHATAAGIAREVVRDLAQQPRMLATSLGALAIGVAGRRPEMIRTGVRLLAAQVATSAVRHATAAVRTTDGAAKAPSGLTALVLGGAATWAAEALVDAAYARFVDPAKDVQRPA